MSFWSWFVLLFSGILTNIWVGVKYPLSTQLSIDASA